MSDEFLRSLGGPKRRCLQEQPAEPEAEKPKQPLVAQGGRSRAMPLGRPVTPDSLLRGGRGGPHWERII